MAGRVVEPGMLLAALLALNSEKDDAEMQLAHDLLLGWKKVAALRCLWSGWFI